ncbi:MAG: YdeI/OmpD-associated family protein [Gorillibacterium sp.]|nr:YdeI/OmpD-associated family protein [Gorillibacterium sp.]
MGGVSITNPEHLYFTQPAEFRKWLLEHHDKASELSVGFYKKDSGISSMTWPESVDEALCFGWIDGVRRRVDEVRYTIRFTPRKPTSIWSVININRFQQLSEQGLVQPAGLRAFAARREEKSAIYSYEQVDLPVLDISSKEHFQADDQAWAFFQKQPSSYQKRVIWWVMSAKKEETKRSRLMKLIQDSHSEKRI